MAKQFPKSRRQGSPSAVTKLPIFTLSGGVSKQAQSKRLPTEAENMDNALVSLERSFEKRPGFDMLKQSTFNNVILYPTIPNDQRFDLYDLEHGIATEKDYWFYWFNINADNRFLIVIDYKATGLSDKLIYIYKLNTDGTWTNNTPATQTTPTISDTTRAYITYGNATNNARDVLKATTIGNSIVILNTLVKAGFSSPDTATSYLYNLDGTATTTTDTKGRKVTYYSSVRYTRGEDNHWYLNTLAGESRAISGTVAVGNTVSFGIAPTLPAGLTNGDPIVITSIIPSSGSYSGGTSIQLIGTNFDGATSVTINGTPCTSVNVIDTNIITCVTPANVGGTYNVIVTTPNGSYTKNNGFTIGTQIAASYGRVGTLVTVTTGGAHGLITGNIVNINFITGGALSGVYEITYVAANTFTLSTIINGAIAPGSNCAYYAAQSVVTSITPNTGVTAGGTTITLLGSGFSSVGTYSVKIGTGDCTSVTRVSDTQLTCVTPSGQGTGSKDLVITHSTISSLGSTITNAFTFQDSIPTIVTTNPSSKNKYYVVKDASNWAVLSGWTSVGIGRYYTVEAITGSILNGDAVTVYSGYFPEVEDFIWHDVADPWIGQSMADFSEIRFPPELAEQKGNNGILLNSVYFDNKAKLMLAALYPTSGDTTGQGKIYYASAPYLNFTNGYYRIISSTSKPYTKKVRSPDAFSVLDERRMPQRILFDAVAATPWTANPIAWEPRTSGDRYSNPGPSIFLSTDKTTPVHRSINAITTFRDRLYMAAEDVVFTSQLGVYEDLFISDHSNIVATDPIDIRASSTTFNEIKTLTPFSNYLFITTLGSVQYELKGSQNQITPLTAEISPTAFYSTATLSEPQTMGSLIYFLDSSKLYLYLSAESRDLAVAQELTVTCADYLPAVQRSICVSPAQNSIVMIDDANLNQMYFHISRFAGDRNIQNAFFRYILNSNDAVLSNQSYEDYLYAIIKRPTTQTISTATTTVGEVPNGGAGTQKYRYSIEKTFMRSLDPSVSRLDRKIKLTLNSSNSSYNASLNETIIKIPLSFPYTDVAKIQMVTDSTWSADYTSEYTYLNCTWGRFGSIVTVTLSNHGFSVGDTINISFNASLTLSGYTGLYVVASIPDSNTFVISVPMLITDPNSGTCVYIKPVLTNRSYEIATPIAYTIKNTYIELVFTGRYVPVRSSGDPPVESVYYNDTRTVDIGLKYTMEVELSNMFVRDQNNNVIDGVLNLRTMTLRHKKTGNYDISVSNRGRTPVISKFTNQVIGDNQNPLTLSNYEEEGEFVTNILGFSDSIQLKITSDYPTPVNIVNMEIKGKFIQKYTSLNT